MEFFNSCHLFSEIRPDSEISVINMPNYVVDELKYSLGKLDLDVLDFFEFGKNWKQTGAELCQAQTSLS